MNKELTKYLLRRVLWVNVVAVLALVIWSCVDYRMLVKLDGFNDISLIVMIAYVFFLTLRVSPNKNFDYGRGFSRDSLWWHTFMVLMLYCIFICTFRFLLLEPINKILFPINKYQLWTFSYYNSYRIFLSSVCCFACSIFMSQSMWVRLIRCNYIYQKAFMIILGFGLTWLISKELSLRISANVNLGLLIVLGFTGLLMLVVCSYFEHRLLEVKNG